MNKIRILVFINDSTGELDWIAPFLLWASHNGYEVYVYLNLPGKSAEEKSKTFKMYFDPSFGIRYLNESVAIPKFYSTLDRYLNSILRRLSGFSYGAFLILRDMVDRLRSLLGRLIGRGLTLPTVDLLMRDYNLKDSVALTALASRLDDPKICIFPHSTAIQSNNENTPKRPPRLIACDLFLENTALSTQYSASYNKAFLAVGSPVFQYFENSQFKIANYDEKAFLFITRNCDERFFGISYLSAGVVFENAIRWASENQYKVYVKHHPRDSRLTFWRKIQAKYDNVEEILTTLNDFSEQIAFVLCLYTSAGLLFTSRQVPVFDVSPYFGSPDRLPFHYLDEDGLITHELVDYGFYAQYLNLDCLLRKIDSNFLRDVAQRQEDILKRYFPGNSCQKIDAAVRKILPILE